ncbi:SufD family Fe-S cluster assembly protein [Apilactobacillus kunkeei]|uniref:SufD family Fe-S cluster assembly protein n=1 Tax=Apilactobacillus kunkeei TaxID=148814 RepID=UPI004033680C
MSMSIQEFAQSHNEPQWLTVKRIVANDITKTLKVPSSLRKFYFASPKLTCRSIDTKNLASKNLKDLGIIIMDLFAAANEFPELIQENLMEKAIDWRDNALNSKHLAYLQSGGFVFIPKDTYVDKSIDISDLVDHRLQEKHLLIIVASGSEVSFTYKDSKKHPYNDRLMIEVLLGDHANVSFYDAEMTNSEKSHRVLNAYLAQNASLKTYVSLFNHGDISYYSNIDLDGMGSSAKINLVSLSDQKQKQVVQTKIINKSPNTSGLITQRGIVADNSKTTYDTTGQIKLEASDSDSDQISRLLTLNPESKGKIDPILLIDNHDVVAGHAASVGKVNSEQLYYLKTRGIDAQTARFLLTRGFLTPLIEKFPDKSVQKHLLNNLEERIHG